MVQCVFFTIKSNKFLRISPIEIDILFCGFESRENKHFE